MQKIPGMGRLERRYLIRVGRESGDPHTALRFLAVARLGLGETRAEVAREIDVACSTVVRAAARFLGFGVAGIFEARRANGQRKVDDRFRRRVAELLRGTPEDVGWCRPTWTRELLCLQLRREGFAEVAVCTMGRTLEALGARLGSPWPIVLCPWPRDARARRLAEIRALEARANAQEPVFYADEVDIHLNPIHKAAMTLRTLAELGGRIVLHFPPYCPDSNRIERAWQDVHANVTRNHRCKTLRHLLVNVRRFVDAYRWSRRVDRGEPMRAAA